MVIKTKRIFKITSCSVPVKMVGNYGNLILRQKEITTKVPVTLLWNFRVDILEVMWVEYVHGSDG